MSKQNEGKNKNPEVSAPAENVQPNETKAEPVIVSITKRVPRIGDSILYTLGQKSRYAGEERTATITKVIDANLNIVQFNVHCATPDDFARNPNVPNWPVAPNTAPYNASGDMGTWRFWDEVKKAA